MKRACTGPQAASGRGMCSFCILPSAYSFKEDHLHLPRKGPHLHHLLGWHEALVLPGDKRDGYMGCQ